MWVMVPMQTVIRDFFSTIEDYPFQPGSSLSASGIGYQTLEKAKAMEALKQLEAITRPGN
jgi:arylsulfatase